MPDWPPNVTELEALARDLLDPGVYGYVAGGAADELTVADNIAAWRRIRLAPRGLVDVGTVDTKLEVLGHRLAHPIVLAPVAEHRSYHPEGEHATMRAAAQGEALALLSTLGTTPIEEIGARATSPFWFQVYVQRDREFTRAMVARAVDAGASALVLTVDNPTFGARDRDRRSGPRQVDFANLRGLPVEPSPWPRKVYDHRFDPTVSWPVLHELIATAGRPVLVKGVLRADVASQAVEAGAAGIVVSNHGGRNLDTAVASADALPRIVAAVAGRAPVFVDGGIRRGTDVAKALMLGASAVLIGRPYIWGLTVGGSEGVEYVLNTLRTELEMAMALLGAPTLADLTGDLIWT